MELSEVIFDLGLKGSRSHRNYDLMVANWYVENDNEIPTYQTCLETWNNVSVPRLLNQIKLEKIREVKEVTNLELSKSDWKIIKQNETNYLSQNDFELVKTQRQSIRDLSNDIETEIMNLATIEEVRNYTIEF